MGIPSDRCLGFMAHFLGFFLLISCSTLKPNKAPDWTRSVPTDGKYEYYVGRAYNVDLEREGIEIATQDAYYQIIREHFGVKTKISKELTESLRQVNYKNRLEELSPDVNFMGIEREDIFIQKRRKGKINLWVLLKISKKTIADERNRLREKLKKDVQWNSFTEAVENNNIEKTASLIKDGVRINGQDRDGNTVLHTASRNGNLRLIELLISHGANLNIKNDDGDIPAHLAVDNNYNRVVKKLILEGSNAEAYSRHGKTLLNWSAEKGYRDIVKFILNVKKVDPDHVDKYGNTPLHRASTRGQKNIVSFLLSKGANKDAMNRQGDKPIDNALKKKFMGIVKILDEKKRQKRRRIKRKASIAMTNMGRMGTLPSNMEASVKRSPRPVVPSAFPNDTVVLGGLDPDTVRYFLINHVFMFRRCYLKPSGHTERSAFSKVGVLNFVIDPSGYATKINIDTASGVPETVKRCVGDALKGIKFPDGSISEVNQPYIFQGSQ